MWADSQHKNRNLQVFPCFVPETIIGTLCGWNKTALPLEQTTQRAHAIGASPPTRTARAWNN
jgi:hypothetical protein